MLKKSEDIGRQEEDSVRKLRHSTVALSLVVGFLAPKTKEETKVIIHRHLCKRLATSFLL